LLTECTPAVRPVGGRLSWNRIFRSKVNPRDSQGIRSRGRSCARKMRRAAAPPKISCGKIKSPAFRDPGNGASCRMLQSRCAEHRRFRAGSLGRLRGSRARPFVAAPMREGHVR
jgi:hypothetical protein